MECDASQTGIGAILYQEDEDREHYKQTEKRLREGLLKEELKKDYDNPPASNRRIIELGSKGLSQTQQNWPATQREMYAIYIFLKQ